MRTYTGGEEIILCYPLSSDLTRMEVGDVLEVDLGEGYSAGVTVKIIHVTKGDDAVNVRVRII